MIDEIARRYVYGSYETKSYLKEEGLLDYLTKEELILSGLGFEEGSLLIDIMEFMSKKNGI